MYTNIAEKILLLYIFWKREKKWQNHRHKQNSYIIKCIKRVSCKQHVAHMADG